MALTTTPLAWTPKTDEGPAVDPTQINAAETNALWQSIDSIIGEAAKQSELDTLSGTVAGLDLSGIATNAAAILAINTLLASDDTTLDEVQEIVDFIKINKSTLDALSIASIAGLQAALDTLTNAVALNTAHKDSPHAPADAPGLAAVNALIAAVSRAGKVFTNTTTRDAYTASEGLICITIDTDNWYRYESAAWVAYTGTQPLYMTGDIAAATVDGHLANDVVYDEVGA